MDLHLTPEFADFVSAEHGPKSSRLPGKLGLCYYRLSSFFHEPAVAAVKQSNSMLVGSLDMGTIRT